MKKAMFLTLAIAVSMPATGADTSVSKVLGSIDIGANQTAGTLSTVNGGIDVGAHSTVEAMDTVNGHLHLGASSTAASMTTVNGGVTLDADAKVKGSVDTVNGSLKLGTGAEVGGTVENVNGDVTIDGAHVVGTLKTKTGSIETRHGARLDAGLTVGKDENNWSLMGHSTPRIVIGPGTVVGGPLKFERKVKLYVSDRAVVKGAIEGAEAVRYSGETAPN